jgi:hypothetical protein
LLLSVAMMLLIGGPFMLIAFRLGSRREKLTTASALIVFALPGLATSIAAGVIYWQLLLPFTALIPKIVSIAVTVLWTALVAWYAVRIIGESSLARRRFVLSSVFLAASVAATAITIVPTFPSYSPDTYPGRVEVLLNGAEEATVLVAISGTGSTRVTSDDYVAPADRHLEVVGVPVVTLDLKGAPSGLVDYALVLSGDMAMTYSSEDDTTFVMSEIGLAGTMENLETFGKVTPAGSCTVDKSPPETIISKISLNSGSVLRGAVALDEEGTARISFAGADPHAYATLQGTKVVTTYPTIETHTSTLECIVGTGAVKGNWVGPGRSTTGVYDVSYSFDGIKGGAKAEQFPAGLYDPLQGMWIAANDAGASPTRAGNWPGTHVLVAQSRTEDEEAAAQVAFRLFLAAILGAIATSLILELLARWPIKRVYSPIASAPQRAMRRSPIVPHRAGRSWSSSRRSYRR